MYNLRVLILCFYISATCLASMPNDKTQTIEIDKCDVIRSLASSEKKHLITESESLFIISFIKKNIHLLNRNKAVNFIALLSTSIVGIYGGAFVLANPLRNPSAFIDTRYLGGLVLGGSLGAFLAYYITNKFIIKNNQTIKFKVTNNKIEIAD